MVFARNAQTKAKSIRTVEGKAIAGTLSVKHLISGEEMTLIEVNIQTGVVAPLHAHEHESLLYVVRGRIRTTIAGESCVLGPGDVCLHARRVPHFVEGLDDSTFVEIKSPVPDLASVLGT